MCVRVQFTRGTVQSQYFYFDRNNFFLLQRIKNTLYYAIFTPSFESLVNAIPFAVFLWKCPPLAPIFGNIQDSVDKCVIVDFYIPTLKQMTIDDFFKKYPSILEKKNLLSQMGKMRIRLSIISLYGQFLYHLTPQETEVLSVLNIPVEISVFSYGRCEE